MPPMCRAGAPAAGTGRFCAAAVPRPRPRRACPCHSATQAASSPPHVAQTPPRRRPAQAPPGAGNARGSGYCPSPFRRGALAGACPYGEGRGHGARAIAEIARATRALSVSRHGSSEPCPWHVGAGTGGPAFAWTSSASRPGPVPGVARVHGRRAGGWHGRARGHGGAGHGMPVHGDPDAHRRIWPVLRSPGSGRPP